jgi:hypothetical protein
MTVDVTNSHAVVARVLPIWRLHAVVTVLVSPFVLVNVTREMTVSWAGALLLVPEVLAQTHTRRVWEWLLPTALLLLLVAYIPIRQSIRERMLFVLRGALLFLRALLSHAIDKGVFAVTVRFLREVAAGLWVGTTAGTVDCGAARQCSRRLDRGRCSVHFRS